MGTVYQVPGGPMYCYDAPVSDVAFQIPGGPAISITGVQEDRPVPVVEQPAGRSRKGRRKGKKRTVVIDDKAYVVDEAQLRALLAAKLTAKAEAAEEVIEQRQAPAANRQESPRRVMPEQPVPMPMMDIHAAALEMAFGQLRQQVARDEWVLNALRDVMLEMQRRAAEEADDMEAIRWLM